MARPHPLAEPLPVAPAHQVAFVSVAQRFDTSTSMGRLDPVWEHLYPAEQARIVQLLVRKVDVYADRADVQIRAEGLTSLVAEMHEEQEVVAA